MKTLRLTTRKSRFRSAFAIGNGALLLALGAGAQAQTSRSHSETSGSHSGTSQPSGGSSQAHSSHPSASTASDHYYSSRGESGRSTGVTAGSAAPRSGKVNYAVLFPAGKSSDIKSAYQPGVRNNTERPGMIWANNYYFGGPPLPPDMPDDSASSKDPDGKDSGTGSKDSGSSITVTVSTNTGSGSNTKVPSTPTTGVSSPSNPHYEESPEGAAARPGQNAPNKPVVHPVVHGSDHHHSPGWDYTVNDTFWLPQDGYWPWPDGTGLYPTPGGVIIKGWPNYSPQTGVSRDEPALNYRIGEKSTPRRPVDLGPALDDIQRAFEEESPRMLASHLAHGESMAVNAPGEPRHFVPADTFLEGLSKFFKSGEAIKMEFDEPQPLESDLFAVIAWYSYRDRTSTVYRARIRLVLQAQDNRVVLTAFEMD